MQPDELPVGDKTVEGTSAPNPWAVNVAATIGVLVSLAYLSNLGAGFIELIPDNIPLVGNLDEAFFTALLIVCMRKLGIDLLPHFRKSG